MLGEVTVERSSPDRLRVCWTWSGTPAFPVTVSVRPTDSSGSSGAHTAVATVEAGDAVEIEVAPNERPVVLVTPASGPGVLTAERRIALEGTLNFRDLGGYVGAGGRRVLWGRVFRSDNFASMPARAWELLGSLGVRSVFDLRHEVERQRSPSTPPEHVPLTTVHLPIGGETAEAPDLVDLLRGRGADDYGIDFMVQLNRALLTEHARVFGTLLTALAEPGCLPAVFHCTAGKDRTGVAAALLLGALGVDRETILDDYELTTHYRSQHRIAELRPRLEAAGIDVEAVRPFLSAPRPGLEGALAEIHATYGTIETYLIEVAAVPPGAIVALRASLLA